MAPKVRMKAERSSAVASHRGVAMAVSESDTGDCAAIRPDNLHGMDSIRAILID